MGASKRGRLKARQWRRKRGRGGNNRFPLQPPAMGSLGLTFKQKVNPEAKIRPFLGKNRIIFLKRKTNATWRACVRARLCARRAAIAFGKLRNCLNSLWEHPDFEKRKGEIATTVANLPWKKRSLCQTENRENGSVRERSAPVAHDRHFEGESRKTRVFLNGKTIKK